MATSIHDPLDTVNLLATKTDPTTAGLADAATAVGDLGRALRLPISDGLPQDVGGYRERFVAESEPARRLGSLEHGGASATIVSWSQHRR